MTLHKKKYITKIQTKTYTNILNIIFYINIYTKNTSTFLYTNFAASTQKPAPFKNEGFRGMLTELWWLWGDSQRSTAAEVV